MDTPFSLKFLVNFYILVLGFERLHLLASNQTCYAN